jgi:hypothetical protein
MSQLVSSTPMMSDAHLTQVVLANAVEYGAQVVSKVMGDDISNVISGDLVTQDYLRTTLAAKIRSYIKRG